MTASRQAFASPTRPCDGRRGAPSLYGSDALAGVINVLTDEPRDRVSVALEQRIESLDGRTSFLSGGTRRDAWSLFATASRVSRDSYDLTPAEPSTTGSAFRKFDASVKAARQARRLEGRASLRVYDEHARDVTATRGVILDDLVDDERWQAVGEVRLQEVANGALTGRVHLTQYSHLLDRVTRASGAPAPDLTRERRLKGGFYHDGRFPDLNAVLGHYEQVFKFSLSPQDRRDLIEYLKSL